MFIIYSFVLMNTHYHLQVNDNGADISKFMKSINQSYAQYYNKKYQRHGHVFADRFKNKPIEDDRYNATTSAYIHNNPKDIKGYDKRVEDYPYSSFRAYLGRPSFFSDIIDTNFILNGFSNNINRARKLYLEAVVKATNSDTKVEVEFENKKPSYAREKHLLVRDFKFENVVDFVSQYTKQNFCLQAKYTHKNSEAKSLCVFLLRAVCDFSLKDICKKIGNITSSGVYRLYEKGFLLVTTNENYKNIINDFVQYSKAA